MKKNLLKTGSVVLSFLAGIFLMSLMTRIGNRDMTTTMEDATLPVVYAEIDGQLCNEIHGYVEEMDGRYMKDVMAAVSQDHQLTLALEKYNAQVKNVSYEVRTMDQNRLIQNGQELSMEDDGQYLRYTLELKDLLEKEQDYLLILQVETESHPMVYYYMQLTYLGENHMKECMDFAREFHQVTVEKQTDSSYLSYLEPNGTMDGKSLGYVNIHSRSGPVTWGDMPVSQTTDLKVRFTDVTADVASVILEYEIENTDTKEFYQVEEALRVRYTASRMYLLGYERTAEKIFDPGKQLTEDGKISFGIRNGEIQNKKNKEENVVGFVQQGQLWCYDFGQNRLSMVYGFQTGSDERGMYNEHDFRILKMEDSGSMNFLVYGYIDRGNYEGQSGILLCRYDALVNTVEEQFFLPSDKPFSAMKEDVGKLAVENNDGVAWISYKGMILQINLTDCSVKTLAENIDENWIQVSDSGQGAAWTDGTAERIYLLDTENAQTKQIRADSGERVRALGFMEEDFIYGTARKEEICEDVTGQEIFPMYRVIIKNHNGGEVREFEYASKGKYVTDISIVENRIDLTCVQLTGDGSYAEALPEPITYTSEKKTNLLVWKTVYDDVKRNETVLNYSGTVKSGNMKRPKVKLVIFEGSRTLELDSAGMERYLAYAFDGQTEGFDTLSESIQWAYENMGSVWKGGICFWSRGTRQTRVTLSGFEETEEAETAETGNALEQCIQRMLRQKQIYTEVAAKTAEGTPVWEICEQELGDNSCILSGCTLDMALYYVDNGMPVTAVTGDGAVLLVGYDPQNVILWIPGQVELRTMGRGDASAAFAEGGNLFFTSL